jgi:hypothetical protein
MDCRRGADGCGALTRQVGLARIGARPVGEHDRSRERCRDRQQHERPPPQEAARAHRFRGRGDQADALAQLRRGSHARGAQLGDEITLRHREPPRAS